MSKILTVIFWGSLIFSGYAHGDDVARRVKKAVEKSTLNQQGTKPFHLKAVLAPSQERDSVSDRSGEIEIWWESPEKWRREVRCPVFHQVEVFDHGQDWQKNDGDYFPEWLRESAIALINPIPNLEDVLVQMKSGEVKTLMGFTHISWMTPSSDGESQSWMGAAVAIRDDNNLLMYGSGFAWSGEFSDYSDFHGRMIARTVAVGSPEVKAKVTMLEDLHGDPTLFTPSSAEADPEPIKVELIDETALRKNLAPMPPIAWPALENGPSQGTVTTVISVDRKGKVREMKTLVAANPGVKDVARQQIEQMHFQPFLFNGKAVQVVSRITLSFKITRSVQ